MQEGAVGEGPPLVETTRPRLRRNVTAAIVGVCLLVFFAMLLSGASPTHPSAAQLIRWGADFGPLTFAGQWWRLLTSVFLHIGIVHLLINMWCLWSIGGIAEEIYDQLTFVAVYLICGIAGALVSVAWHPFVIGAGASGAIFGIAGTLITFFVFSRSRFPARLASLTSASLLVFVGYNLVFGIVTGRVDNGAHIGGFVTGLLLGFFMTRTANKEIVVAGACVVLAAGSAGVARTRHYIVHLERGRQALLHGKVADAVTEFSATVKEKPTYREAYILLGEAYSLNSQFPAAESAYRRALALKPTAGDAAYQLATAVMMQGRLQEAMNLFVDLAKREPENANPWIGVGMTAAMAGNYEKSFTALQQAVRLGPYLFQAHYNLGLAAMQLKRYDVAVAAFFRSTQLQPNSYEALHKLGDAYTAKGMHDEAKAAYERASKLRPPNG